jgi:hypothetical protein
VLEEKAEITALLRVILIEKSNNNTETITKQFFKMQKYILLSEKALGLLGFNHDGYR